jgi:hypothetical protein
MKYYVCTHCAVRPPRSDYMVYDAVWAKAGMQPRRFLCLGCLGPLQPNDFTHAPCNAGLFFGHAMATRSTVTETRCRRGVVA